MKRITQEHKDLLVLMINEWAFKSYVLDYNEEYLCKKFLHRMKVGDSYSNEDANAMNSIRDRWIAYHKGECDSKMSEHWAKFKQHKY